MLSLILPVVGAVIGLGVILFILIMLRVVVPTNMVHIVQRKNGTVPYGRGKTAGNVYFNWPEWVPVIGISRTIFPESNFDIKLESYDAYDSARLPFTVDVVGFFRVDDAEVAAQRISNFNELKSQLYSILQGSVRKVLANNKLETIMQERSVLGDEFTKEVSENMKQWGVIPVKNIEFMDIKDSVKNNSRVIEDIMAKEQSRIEKESRVTIAENQKEAKIKEIDASRAVSLQEQDAMQLIGQRTAQQEREVGISREQAKQEILLSSKITAERDLEVIRVKEVKNSEIEKDVAVINAERIKAEQMIKADADKEVKIIAADAQKQSMVTIAEGNLENAKLNAEGITAEGIAKGKAEEALLMAPINTQIELAKEIGTNQGYQTYLISIKQIEANENVGKYMADALKAADLQIISNGNDNPVKSVSKLADLFSPQGGINLSGMLSGLSKTEQGKALIDKFIPTDTELNEFNED